MSWWLAKTEPEEWSFDDQAKAGPSPWTGVRNFQAQKHMAAMKEGDDVFFYHTGKEKAVVGTARVAKGPYPDPEDDKGRFVLVDMEAGTRFKTPLTLAAIKADARFQHLALVKQSRLSVMPIDDAAAALFLKLGGL
ncbi:EVE domain-containing protein [Pseudokordiimonas caeni]|uniref:EVE domain-containing protein n=1 Tax=Pseudokordiimonas caeni TaxID=2997908 RepID=UPI0028119618|nr:EVE domain-containing protein [Pseudokordiimonas caeni]